MAFFGITLETIKAVWPHPNAERLELASVAGLAFQFVVGKGSFKAGDRVIYFPVDAVLPPETLTLTGFEGKLSGQGKNRVKTVKLRGEISQGLVVPISKLDGYQGELTTEALTSHFGVTKYEPEIVVGRAGNLLPLPEGLAKYDIEGCDRNPEIVESLMDQPVYITEKLEGTNFSVALIGGQVYVNQRGFTIQVIEGQPNVYWETARRQGLLDAAVRFASEAHGDIVIYGELCGPGIQGNIYKLKETQIYVFDIKLDGKWLKPEDFLAACEQYNLQEVPPIRIGGTLREALNGQSVQAYSNGKSDLASRNGIGVKREGIVIKPMTESYIHGFGRLFIKQRSPDYLAGSEN